MIEYSVKLTGNPSRPELSIGAHVYAWFTGPDGPVKKNWDMGGYPAPWAALALSTIREKLRLGYAGVADQTRTGKLESDARNPALVTFSPDSVTLTIPMTQNRYAAAHQYGATLKRHTQAGAGGDYMAMGRTVHVGILPPRPPYQVARRDLEAEGAALAKAILESEGFM